MENTEREIRRELLAAGTEMRKRDLTVETWGNISIRDRNTGLIYITPSGMPYDTLCEDDAVVLDQDGNTVKGNRIPSVEKMMHVLIYQKRADVGAILHTHPLHSAVFAVLHQDIPVITDEMAQAIGGKVRVTDYALPGTMELAENTLEALGENMACLLANHGAVCVGRDIRECFRTAQVLETSAEIYARALAIGTPVEINEENTAYMRDFALHRYGQKKEES